MKRNSNWVVLFALLLGAITVFLHPASDPAETSRVSFEEPQHLLEARGGGTRTMQGAPVSPHAEDVSGVGGHLLPVATESQGNEAVDPTDPAEGSRADREPASASRKSPLVTGNGSDDKRTQEPIVFAADILADADMRDPAIRKQVVARLRAQSELRRAEAEARADAMGMPVREITPAGQVIELQGFDGDDPLYYTTHNANAAISAAVPALYAQPYALNGALMPVGIWDAGSVRSTHQELSGRVTLMNSGTALDDHATHVAGTIAASGVQAQARGMAPAAVIYSLDWNNDLAEMAEGGAATADDTDRLPISNHSYGLITGYMPVSATRWRWFGQGQGTNDVDQNFGRYHASARDLDALAYSLPYYSIFQAAGNDRTDNPSPGDRVDNSLGLFRFNFDPALHPGGDGAYRGGFESISYAALAKNVITVGSAEDAVSGGQRSLAHTGMSSFSSWGPTDDGRIKPDLVANGAGLYSTLSQGDSSYDTYSGTSMATPSAVGAATLLIELYRREFADRLMPASLLRALLVHTADDLGTPGPDYSYGWGLINVERAAALIMNHVQNAGSPRLITSEMTTNGTSFAYAFNWNGSDPIRATLSWTDPAGEAQTAHDSRIPVLVHDLNVAVVGPTGVRYLPYVMPFVGTWTIASLSQPAVTGTNRVDIQEQVFIANPAVQGTYTVEVSLTGALTRSTQSFSLVVSGATDVSGATRVIDLQGDLNFGSLAVGTAATRSMTIRNIGNSPLEVTGLELPAGFSAAWSGLLAPGASQDVTVQFGPAASISYGGNLRVLSDATSGVDTLPLSGMGVAAVLSLTNGIPVPGLLASKGNEQYFVLTVPSGQARLDMSIAGGNGGDADLYVRYGQLPSTSKWDYRPYRSGSAETVRVDNPAAGDWYVMVRAYSSYANVTLTAAYTPPSTPTRILRLGGTLSYGNIPVGDRVVRAATLRNEGSATLTVTGIQLPVGFEGDWAGSIPSGGSQDVDIVFVPLLEQSYAGQLTVSSDKTSGDAGLPVSGNGVLNSIPLQNGVEVGPFNGVIGSSTIFYIDVPAGQHTLEVRLDNDGEGEPDLYVRRGAAPSLDVFDHRAWQDDPRVLLVDTPESGRWYIMLHGVIQYSGARLVVRYQTEVGADRVIRLEPPLDFGVVRVNETSVRTFNIHNDGTAPLNVSGVTYPDGFSGAVNASIPSGSVYQVQVTFSPVTHGLYNGVLTVQSDATRGTNSIACSGEGMITYSANYQANGATSGTVPSSQTKTHDVALTLATNSGNMAKTGYTFAGWNTAANGTGIDYAEGASYTANADVTLYAKWQEVAKVAVYRFWSDSLKSHFFTASEAEKNNVMATMSGVWTYEGIAFYVYAQAVDGSAPVNRFWSDRLGCHVFTISESEKTTLQTRYAKVFTFEGAAWHAFNYQAPGTLPVYRFWAPKLKKPFFTISEAEKAIVIADMSDTWSYKGIAWYAYESSSANAPANIAPQSKACTESMSSSFIEDIGEAAELPGAVIFGLSYSADDVVSAMVHDPAANTFTKVLAPTVSPRELVIPALPFGQRYWLSVMSQHLGDEKESLDYGGWLGRVAEVPAEEMATAAAAGDMPIGLPVEHIVLPESAGPLTLRLYERTGNRLVETIQGLEGGSTYELTVPAWNQWYRLEIGDESSGTVLQTLWMGHLRTH